MLIIYGPFTAFEKDNRKSAGSQFFGNYSAAGAGAIDCAISSMAGFSSQPPVETMLAIFAETSYNANLDMSALKAICKFFIDLAPQRRADFP